MNALAKIVKTGAGQSVQLPEGFGFDADEVQVRRDGDCIVLEPAGAMDPETGLSLDRLRALIADGIASGAPETWDAALIKQEMRIRRA